MRRFSVCLAVVMLPLAAPAHADCASEFAAVVSAMGAGPIRREDMVYKNGEVIEKAVIELSPPDQMKEHSEVIGMMVQSRQISGKQGWYNFQMQGQAAEPTKPLDGAEYFLQGALGLDETNAPLTDCAADGAGTLTLIWKGSDDAIDVHNVASVDAATHLVKTLSRSTLDKRDGSKYERNSTYTAIPAFTVSPPGN